MHTFNTFAAWQLSDTSQRRCHRCTLSLLIVIALLFGLSAANACAQSYTEAISTPAFTAASPVENGFVNLANGNLHLEIPLTSLPQRGGGKATVSLTYDSAIWGRPIATYSLPDNVTSGDVLSPSLDNWGGWRLMTNVGSGNVGAFWGSYGGECFDDEGDDEGPVYYALYPFTWVAPDGTSHSFSYTATTYDPGYCAGDDGTPDAQGVASDGSGYYIEITNYTDAVVYAPDGTIVYQGAPVNVAAGSPCSPWTSTACQYQNGVEDTNGNFYTEWWGNYDYDSSLGYYVYTSFKLVDTLGRTAFSASLSGSTITCTVPDSGGGTNTYTINLESINVHTNFADYISYPSYPDSWSGSLTVVQSLQLPDGTSYSFGYDSGTSAGHYGTVSSMTLPTGGEITYSFSNFSDAIWYGCTSCDSYYQVLYNPRWLTGRTNPDGTWSYSQSVISSCFNSSTYYEPYTNCQQSNKVTKPSGAYSVYTFTLDLLGTDLPWLTELQSYDSSANLLATTKACYSFVAVSNGSCSYSVSSSEYSGATTPLEKLAETTTLPIPGSNVSTTTEYTWGSSYQGQLSQKSEWNFGNAPTNAADRTTAYTYLTASGYGAGGANILNRPTEITVTSGGSTVADTRNSYDGSSLGSETGRSQHDDTNYSTTNTVRGNLTQVQRLVTGSTYLTTSMIYDMLGNITSSTDSNSNTTGYGYTDNFYSDSGDGSTPGSYSPSTSTNAYITTITYPTVNSVTLTKTLGYYWGTGQQALSTDANSNTTYFHDSDPLNRPTSTSLPNGGWTLTAYDVSGSVETGSDTYTGITSTLSSGCTSCRHDAVILDSSGRTATNALVNDPDGETYTNSSYNSDECGLGSVTNPYRTTSDSTYGAPSFGYDGLCRKNQITQADSSVAHTYYGAQVSSNGGRSSMLCSGYGYPTLSIDEAGNLRQSWTDGLGRLVEVDEPNSGSLSLATCYTYDANNNVLGVSQGSQTRSFTYDSLSRLTSAANVEESEPTYYCYTQGSTCSGTSTGSLCSGDPNAVCRRTDANYNPTTYCYDALNRMTGKQYAATSCPLSSPDVSYSYDSTSCLSLTVSCYNLSKRTGMSDGSGSTSWAYDAVGNVLRVTQTINSSPSNVTEAITYSYNNDSSLASITYPSGRTITYTTGNAERPLAAQDTANSINYATSAHYAPPGELAALTNGSGISFTAITNNRLQPCWQYATTGTALSWNSTSCTGSATSGNIIDLKYSYNSGSSDNGNVVGITNNIDNTRSQTFTYDSLNRLATAAASTYATSPAHCWGESYTIDRYNNMTAIGSISSAYDGCSGENLSITVNTGTNRIAGTGYTYDSNGNVTNDTLHAYSFDVENRLTQVDSGATATYTYDGDGHRVKKSSGTLYWYGTNSEPIAETDSAGNTANEYIFFNGKRIARRKVQ